MSTNRVSDLDFFGEIFEFEDLLAQNRLDHLTYPTLSAMQEDASLEVNDSAVVNSGIFEVHEVVDVESEEDMTDPDTIYYYNGTHYYGNDGGEAIGFETINGFAVLSKKNHFVTPEMYGAIGDGVTDDTQAFIDCFADAENKYVYLSGEYLITSSIPVNDKTVVFGKGVVYDRRIGSYASYNGLFHAEQKEGVRIEYVTIKGQNAGITKPYKVGIYFHECENCEVYKVNIENVDHTWAILSNGSNHTRIAGCNINEYSYGGIGNIGEGNDFAVIDNRVCECLEPGTLNYGIMLNGYDTYPAVDSYGGKGLKAIGNYLYNTNSRWEMIDAHGGNEIIVANNTMVNAASGINVFSNESNHYLARDVVIEGNTIICDSDIDIQSNSGIVVGGENVVVNGNTIKNGGAGTNVPQGALRTTTPTNNVNITNNIIENSFGIGIRLGGMRGKCSNNIIDGINTQGGENAGIYCVNGIYNAEISDNTIKDCETGLFGPRAITNTDKRCKFSNNDIDATSMQSIAAIDGIIPQLFSSASAFNTAKAGDHFYTNSNDPDTPAEYIYDGVQWRGIGMRSRNKSLWNGSVAPGDPAITIDPTGYSTLGFVFTGSGGSSVVTTPTISGIRYVPVANGSTISYVRYELQTSNKTLQYLACPENMTLVNIYGMI